MKKKIPMGYVALGIAFVLFNVIAFAVPTAKTATFWIAYVFTAVAFASQIAVWKLAFKDGDTLKSKFLGIPLISVGTIYLIVQIIAFAIFMAYPTAPAWAAVVVCALILGVSAICLIGTDVGKEEIVRVEKKVEKKVFYIKALQVDVEMAAETEADAGTKTALLKLAEKLRFSDPMSNEALAELEAEIADKVKELKTAENKQKIIDELNLLLTERNKKTKLLK